jgi:phosphoribosyl-ATP pyrophosphohydrolase
MSSYAEVELQIVRWGEARGIVANGTPHGQALKTAEEAQELIDAINAGDKQAIVDAIGDIGVTLIMQCALQDVNFTDCLYHAYEQIKDRKGFMNSAGIFVKEAA